MTQQRPPDFSQRSFEQAVAWFVALQSDGIEADRQAEFQHWLKQHPSHELAFAEAERLWANLEPLKTATVPGLSEARAARRQSSRVGSKLSMLLIIALGWGWWSDYQIQPLVYKTGIGQKQIINLADGSTVQLNPMSQLSVHMSWCRRSLELQRGDAVFDVAHETLRPFTVHAGELRVRDIGTRFVVRQRTNKIKVAVLVGEVALKSDQSWLEQSLVEGRSLEMDRNGNLLTMQMGNLESTHAWLEGRLLLERTPLAEVAAELERYHPVKFVFTDPALINQTISGSFDIADLKPFLRALETMLPIEVQRKQSDIVLSQRR
jgi:transmembrane sensor